MKILIVNTYDFGGAAHACLRLHQGLLSKGIESKLLLKKRNINIHETYQFNPKTPIISRKQKFKEKAIRILKELKLYKSNEAKSDFFIRNRPMDLEMFSYPFSTYDITETDLYKEADIINLHWVANFLDYKSFFEKNTKPVVWTLHDMNPFTGGEHYTEVYNGIDENGFPQVRKVNKEEKLESKRILELKKSIFQDVTNLNIVCPSNWLMLEANKSELFKKYPVHVIPNGVNHNIFAPRDSHFARDVLGIPQDKTVILFVADSLSNNRKGYIYLKRAFEKLQDENVVLCAIGNKKSNLENHKNIIEIGSIKDERMMSIVYSAADVFVIPSLMDNLPNTVLESLMCGTPVIGFPIGGVPDLVQAGENGFIAEEISVESLQKVISRFLMEISIFDSQKIRKDAVKRFSLDVQAEAYSKLFKEII